MNVLTCSWHMCVDKSLDVFVDLWYLDIRSGPMWACKRDQVMYGACEGFVCSQN